jgi:hypothetical protein
MADQMQPTPRSTILGLFSDIVNLPLQYMSSPERTQQMQGTAQFLYETGIPKTLDRLSYGDSLFSGAGMTLRPREETINAAMTVAPFAPAVGRVIPKVVRATEGLPVGMGIKDVSPKIGINVNQGGSSFADKIISGEKKFETRESDSLRSYVGKRVGIIRTGEGKAKAIGDVTLGEPIVVSSAEEFAKLRDLHLVPEGSKFDIKEGGVKYLYPIENPVPYGVEKDVAKYGIVSRKILGEPDTLEKAIYPQQAALDLAQERAALPIEQGGLGLPANNTAADRAKAMGFDTDLLHGTAQDFPAFDLSKAGTNTRQAGDELGIFSTSKPFLANDYAQIAAKGGWANRTTPENAVVYPLVGRFNNPKKYQTASEFYRDADAMAADQNLGNWRRQLQGEGYDAVFVRPDLEEVVAFSPDQLRSRFAAFDPFRKDVATATAMGVAAPDLLAQTIDQYQIPQETTPMYTDPFGNTIGSSIR